ncbi:MAG: class I SAM-dependent methyltransferase [Clostridiales bacterium]|nr:class I SAM-dependent methyltransferase [Clostridiales bacterium]
MNGVNKTLYIPLYGKAHVSEKGLFLDDKKAEEIWKAEGFALKGKSKSKWLAYYMGIRSAVFDDWLRQQMADTEEIAVIHIGCGMDSRVLRVGTQGKKWYDVDFPQVIEERKRYYAETTDYQMLAGDVREAGWLASVPKQKRAIVVMEGVSMYLSFEEVNDLTAKLCNHFEQVMLLMDCYSVFAAKMSKHKNPINDVGVTKVYGIDNPEQFQHGNFVYVKEHTMIPQRYIDELKGLEKFIFGKLYAGGCSKKLYRLFEYRKV